MIEDTISSCREALIRVRMERRRLVPPAPRLGTHVFTLQEIGDAIDYSILNARLVRADEALTEAILALKGLTGLDEEV